MKDLRDLMGHFELEMSYYNVYWRYPCLVTIVQVLCQNLQSENSKNILKLQFSEIEKERRYRSINESNFTKKNIVQSINLQL